MASEAKRKSKSIAYRVEDNDVVILDGKQLNNALFVYWGEDGNAVDWLENNEIRGVRVEGTKVSDGESTRYILRSIGAVI